MASFPPGTAAMRVAFLTSAIEPPSALRTAARQQVNDLDQNPKIEAKVLIDME
jgi:hypothetical protein